MIRRGAAVLLALACGAAAAEPREKQAALWSKLRSRIEAVDSALDGGLGVFVKDLSNGATVEIRPDEVFPQASSIKLAVLYELYRQSEEGRIDLQEVTRPPLPRVGGDGVLYLLSDRVSLTWRDLAALMMGWSDNGATNLLIERVGLPAVNRRLDALGLPRTRLKRKMMDLEAARRGDENVSTPSEMAALVEHLYRGTGLSAARGKDLLAVATTPKRSGFEIPHPDGVLVAGKTGSLDGVRCWSAIVLVPGRPYVAAVMTTFLRRDSDGEAAIREIASALYETFDRLARSSDLGRALPPR